MPVRKRKASHSSMRDLQVKPKAIQRVHPVLGPPVLPIPLATISSDIKNNSIGSNDPISTSYQESTNDQSWTSLKNKIIEEYKATSCITTSMYVPEGKALLYPSPHTPTAQDLGNQV